MKSVGIACILMLVCARAHAEDAHEQKGTVAPLQYAFDDELVAGDYPSPPEILTVVRTRGRRGSLIEVRESFVRELTQSVEQL